MNAYPQDLIKLLKSLKKAKFTKPTAQFRLNARIRLMNSIAEQTKPEESSRLGFVSRLLNWRLATVLSLILLFLGATTVAAAQKSLPGDMLYPLKIASERALLAITPFEAWKIRLASNFANRRLEEMRQTTQEETLPVDQKSPPPANVPSDQSIEKNRESVEGVKEENQNVPGTLQFNNYQETVDQLLNPSPLPPSSLPPLPTVPSPIPESGVPQNILEVSPQIPESVPSLEIPQL